MFPPDGQEAQAKIHTRCPKDPPFENHEQWGTRLFRGEAPLMGSGLNVAAESSDPLRIMRRICDAGHDELAFPQTSRVQTDWAEREREASANGSFLGTAEPGNAHVRSALEFSGDFPWGHQIRKIQ